MSSEVCTVNSEEKIQKRAMVWNKERDFVLLKEIAAEGVMYQKPKSRDKGAAWQRVVHNINALSGYEVSSRSIRDRFNTLAKKQKAKMANAERLTGEGGSELDEWETILEDLIEVCDDAEQRAADEWDEKQILVNEDKAKAMEMRKRAMETIGETRSRTGEGNKEEQRRRSANRSFQWLQEAIESKQKQAVEERKTREDERRQREEERLERREERKRQDQERNDFFKQI